MVPGRGGSESDDVRADVVYFETPDGGAVFSVGSIDWTASLSYNGCDNDIARITGNVLRTFAADSLPDVAGSESPSTRRPTDSGSGTHPIPPQA